MPDETCATCTHWRTPIGKGKRIPVERRICPMIGTFTYATQSCGYYKEALPFDDEPEPEAEKE